MLARGYTLLELLVVAALIALAAGMLTLGVRGDEPRRLREEAERLAALFTLAQSEARVSGRALLWEADLEGYGFRLAVADAGAVLREELARRRQWALDIERVEQRELLFAREPVREPAEVQLATRSHAVRIAVDALGHSAATDCGGPQCAASR